MNCKSPVCVFRRSRFVPLIKEINAIWHCIWPSELRFDTVFRMRFDTVFHKKSVIWHCILRIVVWHCILMKSYDLTLYSHEIIRFALYFARHKCDLTLYFMSKVWFDTVFHANTVSNHNNCFRDLTLYSQSQTCDLTLYPQNPIQCQITIYARDTVASSNKSAEIQCQIAFRTVKYSVKSPSTRYFTKGWHFFDKRRIRESVFTSYDGRGIN